ncbi:MULTISPECIES: ribbon-helix-helix domain-containing protein [unclassified Rhizobium]|uniref:ribbon-helix-helix domain-containing protein n=1 Tax=unclassified Rhizobium TaxID=2613769 RepID=UPI0007154CC7|nr:MULTISPECIES: ribbon-helix-helix domain-containing protein [unclassified Rhizobium]KQS98192.1 intracellular proteinase I [Rhizobium sp. Leaf386]KQT00455.1 intracellular proteinase I [Rhizobium sp. Leaf391]KQT97458.1 intracellular proteinase I [Rhizobium sp. Leaf453]
MCRLFIGADPALWQGVTRSVRIHGVATSIRLESFFWSVLEDIADRDHMSVGRLIGKLYGESVEEGHALENFTSFLRVCCSRYLALQLDGLVPTDRDTTIASLDAESILIREDLKREKRAQGTFPRIASGH